MGEIDWEKEDAIVSDLTAIAIVGIQDPVRPGLMLNALYVTLSVFLTNLSWIR